MTRAGIFAAINLMCSLWIYSPESFAQDERYAACANLIPGDNRFKTTQAIAKSACEAASTAAQPGVCIGPWSLTSTTEIESTRGGETAFTYLYGMTGAVCQFSVTYHQGCQFFGAEWSNVTHTCVHDSGDCLEKENDHYATTYEQMDFPVVTRPVEWAGCVDGCVVAWSQQDSSIEQKFNSIEELKWFGKSVFNYTGGTCEVDPDENFEPETADTDDTCPSGSSKLASANGQFSCVNNTTGETVEETDTDPPQDDPEPDPTVPADRLSDRISVPTSFTLTPVDIDIDDTTDALTTIDADNDQAALTTMFETVTGYLWTPAPSATCPLLDYGFFGVTPTTQWTSACGWLVLFRYVLDIMFGVITMMCILSMFDKSAWMSRA